MNKMDGSDTVGISGLYPCRFLFSVIEHPTASDARLSVSSNNIKQALTGGRQMLGS